MYTHKLFSFSIFFLLASVSLTAMEYTSPTRQEKKLRSIKISLRRMKKIIKNEVKQEHKKRLLDLCKVHKKSVNWCTKKLAQSPLDATIIQNIDEFIVSYNKRDRRTLQSIIILTRINPIVTRSVKRKLDAVQTTEKRMRNSLSA